MPVSSPYAVFRAADLNWPPRSPLVMMPAPALGPATPGPRKRRPRAMPAAAAATTALSSACIQGNLFPLGLCC
ncbi:MAG: hypothetical protein VKI83_05865 [Synechococcaceae cyanobacterium]|nr:hypothetical protein [Synechococcaceae cyanobacterium]